MGQLRGWSNIVRSYIVCGCLVISSFGAATGQNKAQLRQQVETQLKRMSPEEIERRLKEFGIAREEAIRRASELNISLEEYLAQAVASDTTPPPPGGMPSQLLPVPKVPQLIERPVEKRLVAVPGFTGRAGVGDLQPFGFDLFGYPEATFEPVLNVATPPSYLLGPGDEVVITVWGETRLNYQLNVNREGNVIVPEVGPVGANGTTITQLRERLLRRMSAIYSGLDAGGAGANTFLDVSLGKLRTLQVFVLGEVERPGAYAISSFATAFNALYQAGGPTVSGTMRSVQVVRKGESPEPIDLYDYIIRGDNSKDHRLQDGDIVFVKPAGTRVALVGEVVRPAIYEVKQTETLGDLMALAGGLRFNAYTDRLHLERIIPFEQRHLFEKNVLDIDLRFGSIGELVKSPQRLEDGDVVTVFRITDFVQNRVSITGNVNKPGQFELKAGMRIGDLVREADSLQRNTFSERGTLFRMLPNLRREILPFNPRLALEGSKPHNILLQNEDSVVVYLGSQFFPQHTVSINGAVRSPGTFVRSENMSVADLVVMAGGLTEAASLKDWEISRLDTTDLGIYSSIQKINAASDYWNDPDAKRFSLHDFDFVFIPSDPRYTPNRLVQISGYVMNPGFYAIKYEGERLAELINRAGGLRPGAYLEGSRFVRKLRNTGVIPIDFPTALARPESRDNVLLNEGDSVHVAFQEDVVYVTGEVIVPTAVLHKKGEGMEYYISQAGGYSEDADEGRASAFLPSGKKWEPGWFFLPDPELLPGSTVVVPRKAPKEDTTLPIIRDMATILASLAALTVAMVQITK